LSARDDTTVSALACARIVLTVAFADEVADPSNAATAAVTDAMIGFTERLRFG